MSVAYIDPAIIDAELGSRSLREFVALAWPLVEPATPLIPNWHLDAVCEHLEAVSSGQITNLLINIPPACSKSLLVSVFWPCWEWARNPSLRWLCASYDQQLATRDAIKSRSIVTSEWYQERWPGLTLSRAQDEKTYYETEQGGYRLSTSIGGHGTGQHPDRIVVDDPHNVKRAESKTERQNVIQWWDLTLGLRGLSRGVRRVVIMQRLHEEDLSGHILRTDPSFVHLCLPMEFEPGRMSRTPIGWNDPRRTAGELLAPIQFPADMVVVAKRKLGAYGASGQLQQRPSPEEGGLFKRDDWQYWDAIPRENGKIAMDQVIQSWDMAFKDTDGSDFVVGQVWARKGADFWLLDQVRDRLDFPATCEAVKRLSVKWPDAKAKLIEDKANGPAVISQLRHVVPGLMARNVGRAEGDKYARASAVSPLVQSHNVYLPRGLEWVSEFKDECAAFPNAANDDMVDAMSQALMFLEPQAYQWTKKPVPDQPKTLEDMRARMFAEKVKSMTAKPRATVPERYKIL